jgi:hypothetical protein
MGLFSNNKKLCPVCGNPTPRLLATKIQDTPICKECDKKIYLPKGRTDRMTIDDFKQYIQFYEDNQALRDQFEENYSFNFGLFKIIDGHPICPAFWQIDFFIAFLTDRCVLYFCCKQPRCRIPADRT